MEKGAFAAGVLARHHIREGVPPHWCLRPLLWAELLKITRSPGQRQAAPEYLSCEGAWLSPLPSSAPNSARKGGLPLDPGTRLRRSLALLWLSRFLHSEYKDVTSPFSVDDIFHSLRPTKPP